MERVLRLLLLLAGRRWYTRDEITRRTGIQERSFYRYLNTFEDAGLVVERSDKGYRLLADSQANRSLSRLLHFTEEEAYILHKTLSLLEDEGPARERLLRKLHTLYDCRVWEQAGRQPLLERAAMLREAMNKQRRCILLGYRSGHSGAISDRIVEPFEFGDNYESVWAWEPASKQCKQFKLARMESVQLLNDAWQHADKHQIWFTDAFGFAAVKPLGTVKATLSMLAANLLREEYPLTERHLNPSGDGRYRLVLPVGSWKGIGRFIMGLRKEIELEGPAGLKKYIGE